MKVNGIAHIQLTVNDFKRSVPFYEKLLDFLEMELIYKTDDTLYYVGSRTGIAITKADEKHKNDQFIQRRVGLHHFCFRAYERNDIDKIYEFLNEIEAKIVRPPEEGSWAEGYYSILFEDPDGIRIEVCFVPGAGNLQDKTQYPKAISLI